MAKFNFYLENPASTAPTRVLLYAHWNGMRLKYPTGFKVLPKHWSDSDQRAIMKTNRQEQQLVNERLEFIQSIGVSAVQRFAKEHGRPPERAELRKVLEQEDGKVRGSGPMDVLSYFADHNAKRLNGRNSKTSKLLHSTLHGRNRKALEYLTEYVAQLNNGKLEPLHFSRLDGDFIREFHDFLAGSKGLAANTIGKYMKALREVINDAYKNGKDQHGKPLEIPRSVMQRGAIPIPEEETTSVYLNERELEEIYALDLSASPRLDRVRDLFIVGCWTGLRFGDLSTITTDDIEGSHIRLKTSKTGKYVKIPLKPEVGAIIEKWKGVPSGISNQKQNKYLREVMVLVPSLESKVVVERTVGGEPTRTVHRKWELVTTHTARRSFATNYYREGTVSTRSIMNVTSHTTERAFFRYIRMTDEDHMEEWKKSELFNKAAKPSIPVQ
jgi:integrase